MSCTGSEATYLTPNDSYSLVWESNWFSPFFIFQVVIPTAHAHWAAPTWHNEQRPPQLAPRGDLASTAMDESEVSHIQASLFTKDSRYSLYSS